MESSSHPCRRMDRRRCSRRRGARVRGQHLLFLVLLCATPSCSLRLNFFRRRRTEQSVPVPAPIARTHAPGSLAARCLETVVQDKEQRDIEAAEREAEREAERKMLERKADIDASATSAATTPALTEIPIRTLDQSVSGQSTSLMPRNDCCFQSPIPKNIYIPMVNSKFVPNI